MSHGQLPRYMNMGQACQYFNVKSRNTLKKYINAGLKVVVVNGVKRIDQVDADKFMDAHKVQSNHAGKKRI